MTTLCMIAAMGKDNCIGIAGGLPFRLADDLRRFRASTMDKPIVMGRRTWESLPRRPLPGRLNIVLSRATTLLSGAVVIQAPDKVFAAAGDVPEVMIIGGGEIYRLFLPLASRMLLTVVDANVPGGDTFFPSFEDCSEWSMLDSTPGPSTDGSDKVCYQEWVRT